MPVGEIRLSTKGRKLPPIEIYEWTLLRFPGWSGDAPIANITNWLNWFDQRGIPAPRLEVEHEEAREKAAEAAEERWKKGMPSGVREIWDKTSQNRDTIRPDSQLFADVLQREFPQKDNRIRAIFKWYGSGMGPWSGYQAHEQIGETLLLQYSTKELVHALDDVEWDDQLKEGVARLFAGWDFNSQRPEANTQIPSELKSMLLTYSLKSSDEDRIGRARKAFEH
jgi:hypothetical protein